MFCLCIVGNWLGWEFCGHWAAIGGNGEHIIELLSQRVGIRFGKLFIWFEILFISDLKAFRLSLICDFEVVRVDGEADSEDNSYLFASVLQLIGKAMDESQGRKSSDEVRRRTSLNAIYLKST